MAEFDSVESMLRSSRGRSILIRWTSVGAAVAGLTAIVSGIILATDISLGLMPFIIVLGACWPWAVVISRAQENLRSGPRNRSGRVGGRSAAIRGIEGPRAA